jgi:hypothetical protein
MRRGYERTRDGLGGRHPQRHLVLDEADDDQFELGAGDLLLLDRDDLATPWAGYTTNSLVLKPCRWVVFLMVIPVVAGERPLLREERNLLCSQ